MVGFSNFREFTISVLYKCFSTHLINSQYCDGGIGGQLDAPVFDQVRLQNTSFKHVLHCRAISLKTSPLYHQSLDTNTATYIPVTQYNRSKNNSLFLEKLKFSTWSAFQLFGVTSNLYNTWMFKHKKTAILMNNKYHFGCLILLY